MQTLCEQLAHLRALLGELPDLDQADERQREDAPARVAEFPPSSAAPPALPASLAQACACLRAELDSWWSSVIIRPAPQRGLTSTRVLVFELQFGLNVLLPGDPTRRMFSVMHASQSWQISTSIEALNQGQGFLANGSGTPYLFQDDDWGEFISQPWYVNNFGGPIWIGIAVENYINYQPGGRQ